MLKSKIKIFIYSYFPILVILLMGAISITWFRGNYLIYHGDQCLPLSPIKDFLNFSYCWNHLMHTGFPNPPGYATFFYFGFFALMEFLGFSLVASEKIFYYFLFTASGLSLYYLTTFFINRENRNTTGLASALFYMFNFFPILMFWSGFSTLAIFYSFMPLILALYVKLLKTESNKRSYVAIIFSISILTWTTMAPTYIACLFLISSTYFIYFALENYREKIKIKSAFLLTVFLLFSYILLNIWWMMPAFLEANIFFGAAGVDIPRESLSTFNIWSTSFLKLFRLLTPWTFDISFGDFLFPWAWVYSTTPFLILGFIPPLLAFIPFLSKQKNRAIFYFGPLFLLGLFLMKGMHPPLGQINEWLFINIPFFVFFRNPYEKFGPVVVLSFAVLIGIGVNVLYVRLKKNKRGKYLAKMAIGLLIFLIIGVYMWPFWTGDLIYAGGKIKPSARVRIPDCYYEAKEWLSQQREQFKILSLPHQEGVCYDWEHGYVGSDEPAVRLFQRPILTTYIPNDEIIGPYLSNLFGLFTKPRGSKNIARFLGLTSIKYVLLHNDINYHINTPDPEIKTEDIKSILNSREGIHLERSFDKFDFYKIYDEYFLPLIYPSTAPTVVSGDIETLVSMVETKDIGSKPALFFNKQEENKDLGKRKGIPKLVFSNNKWELLEPVTSEEPLIIFKKINPTKYIVKVESARNPFWLVFCESFNKEWRLYKSQVTSQKSQDEFADIVADYSKLKVKEARYEMEFTPLDIKYLFRKSITDNHYLVNGYANGWYIDPKELGLDKDFTLVLYFWPQSLFYLGLGISGLTFLGCIGYLVGDFLKRGLKRS